MRRYKIMIADDEEQFRSTISSCFPWNEWGFEVAAQVSNGQEALEYLSHNKVDVIFSDIQMPIINGLEMAEKISKMEHSPVLVFFSGYQEFEYAKKALQYGVKNYIVKPVRFDELLDTLKSIRQELDGKHADTAEKMTAEDAFVETVQEYVKNNLKDASLSEIAGMLFMNPSYVSQLYKQKTGANFSEFLMKMPYEKGRRIAQNTCIPCI